MFLVRGLQMEEGLEGVEGLEVTQWQVCQLCLRSHMWPPPVPAQPDQSRSQTTSAAKEIRREEVSM